MATSPDKYRVRVGSQFNSTGLSPISSTYTRRILQGNLCHYADVAGQVRASWVPVTSTYSAKAEYMATATPTFANYPTWCWSSGPFPIMRRANGNSYKMRLRIAGASSNNTHAVKFYAVLGAVGLTSPLIEAATDATFITATTTSSTAAWLTGASQGTNAYTTMVEMTPEACERAMQITSTISTVGGDPRSVAQCLVELVVYASTANTAATAQLCGMYAAEWVGD